MFPTNRLLGGCCGQPSDDDGHNMAHLMMIRGREIGRSIFDVTAGDIFCVCIVPVLCDVMTTLYSISFYCVQ